MDLAPEPLFFPVLAPELQIKGQKSRRLFDTPDALSIFR
jgi:hypothetical protein